MSTPDLPSPGAPHGAAAPPLPPGWQANWSPEHNAWQVATSSISSNLSDISMTSIAQVLRPYFHRRNPMGVSDCPIRPTAISPSRRPPGASDRPTVVQSRVGRGRSTRPGWRSRPGKDCAFFGWRVPRRFISPAQVREPSPTP